jgi:hypothetical protein
MENEMPRLVAAYLAEMGLDDPAMARHYLQGLYQSAHAENLSRWLTPEEAEEAARLVEVEGARRRFSRLLAA